MAHFDSQEKELLKLLLRGALVLLWKLGPWWAGGGQEAGKNGRELHGWQRYVLTAEEVHLMYFCFPHFASFFSRDR